MTPLEIAGLVLAVVGIAFAFEAPRKYFLRTLRLDRPNRPGQALAAEPVAESPISRSGITVAEIVSTLRAAPPFQRKQLSEQYVGISVVWQGYMKSAELDWNDKESVRVNLLIDNSSILGDSFWFTEKIARIPEIKTLPTLSLLRVKGTILSASAEGLCVTLKPEAVEVIARAPS